MSIMAIVGFILAIINPVIGGVLVGYLVWLDEPDTGLQIILLALTVFSLLVIGFTVWAQKKIKKLEKELKSIQERH
ncbi:hypothetical protein ACFLV8_00445 [Chloroflexota bacterium]